MQRLNTIEEVHKVFHTNGSSPLLVTCDDFRDWVCKYDKSPMNLFNELLAAKFAEIWSIKTPEIALIKVNKEHVPQDKYPKIAPHLFDKDCFGSLYLESSKEIDSSVISLFKEPSFRDRLGDKEDFLKIALFDIWIANEDRNHNNFNLLLYASPEKINFIYAIDHVNIFNSSFLNYRITDITEEESIIKTDLAKILFRKKSDLPQIVNNLIESFYLCTNECFAQLDKILDLVPDSWGIDRDVMKNKISENLFSEEWNQICERKFREFTQSFLVKKK